MHMILLYDLESEESWKKLIMEQQSYALSKNKSKSNKKSAESDVAPAGIKSYKFLFVLKKNLFCSIQEIDRLEKWTK